LKFPSGEEAELTVEVSYRPVPDTSCPRRTCLHEVRILGGEEVVGMRWRRARWSRFTKRSRGDR